MIIRKFENRDLDAVMNIANKMWKNIRLMTRNSLGDTIADLISPQGDDFSKGEQLKAQIKSNLFHIYVCENDNKIISFITYSINGDWGEISNNAVDKDCGLKAVGQFMYKHAIEDMKKNNVKVVKVTTGLDEAHAMARRAYERAGFEKNLESITYFKEI